MRALAKAIPKDDLDEKRRGTGKNRPLPSRLATASHIRLEDAEPKMTIQESTLKLEPYPRGVKAEDERSSVGALQLGQWLLGKGYIRAEQLKQALDLQKRTDPEPLLGEILRSIKAVDEEKIAEALAAQIGVGVWDLKTHPPDPKVKGLIPGALAQSLHVIPQSIEDGILRCVTIRSVDAADRAKLEFLANHPIVFSVATDAAFAKWLQQLYGLSVERMIEGLTMDAIDVSDQEVFVHDLREMASEPTLVNLVNKVIAEAIEQRASDIHVEPFESEIIIKYRIDGALQVMPPPPKQFQSAIVSRIKIMSQMDIAERYIPQDGQIRVNLPTEKVDIRVSTVPTVFGESVVLRLLNKDEALLNLTNLGIGKEPHRKLTHILELPYGILIVCGPTGSGKSTTLYGALKQIYTPEKKIITIEDPVEYQLHGINQIPVRPKRGLTFASGLRSLMRQDPDIIMVGEIRDRETADIAIRAALTGHLVLSTLHTNDAPGTVTRLIDMGVEPFLIASSVQAVLGQRLVRRLCPECRVAEKPNPDIAPEFESDFLPELIYRRGEGACERCKGRGFLGRIGIYELMTMNEKLHDLILARASATDVREVARTTMQSMRQDGWDKICRGMTTVAEVIQATRFEQGHEQ
jgi:type II secretory ATPase GspE/PulE/Tfp pilus assembly ATPase PilB-like protein